MTKPSLSSDDLPSSHVDPLDQVWRQQLEALTARYFYEACDGVTQAVLSSCQWSITSNASALTLIITCPNLAVHLRLLNNFGLIAAQLAPFSSGARIRVCSAEEPDQSLEIRVDEASGYLDAL